ncbi:unnamed protein product, partial [Ectocarpus sp. 12 AP-2014]
RSGATCSFWPIPEPFWVDRTVDPLPPRREAQPELVFRKTGSAAAGAAGTATTSPRGDLTHPRELLEKLGVGVDQYELEWCGSGTRLDIPRSETWQLFVKDTSQPPSPDSTPPPAFGYLRASLTTGRPLMMVLPYNYEVLIPLLQARASTLQATKSTAPPAAGSPWARDFMAYIKGVPTYYLPSLQRVLQPFGVQALIPGEGLQSGGGVLHRKVTEKLNSLKELAGRQVERADRIERAGRAKDPEQRQQQQQDNGQSAGPLSSSKSALYSNAFQVPVGELLSQWEIMRTQLFGTGGATVSGLFSAGPVGQRRLSPPRPTLSPSDYSQNAVGDGATTSAAGRDRNQPPLDRRESSRKHEEIARGTVSGFGGEGGKAVLRSPVLASVAESLAPARSTHEMSDFMTKMKGVEFPRDPMREPGPDEHMRQAGGFQRLMAATTFESPFAKKKKKKLGIDYSPLELDEAANESAVLDMEDEEDDAAANAKTDKNPAGTKVGDNQALDNPAPGASAAADSSSSAAGGGNDAAASSSSSSLSSGGTADGNQPGGSAGGGGMKRMSSFTRKMLPKLVATRGRHKMGRDRGQPAAAAAAAGAAAKRGDAAGANGSTGHQRPPDVPPRPTPGTAAAAGVKDARGLEMEQQQLRREDLDLVPPMSPALTVPRTPDYSPPASPAYHEAEPVFEGDSRYEAGVEQGEVAASKKSAPSPSSPVSAMEEEKEEGGIEPSDADPATAPAAAPAPAPAAPAPAAPAPAAPAPASSSTAGTSVSGHDNVQPGSADNGTNGYSAAFEKTPQAIAIAGIPAPSAAVAVAVAAAAAAAAEAAAKAAAAAAAAPKPAHAESNGSGAREPEPEPVPVPVPVPVPRAPVTPKPQTPTPPRPRPPPPRPPPPKPSPSSATATSPPLPSKGPAATTAGPSFAPTKSPATQARQAPPKPRPPPPRQPPPSAPAAAAGAAAAAAAATTADAADTQAATFTPTTSPAAKFTPTASPATFTPTASPATFTPTASPATRTVGGAPAFA